MTNQTPATVPSLDDTVIMGKPRWRVVVHPRRAGEANPRYYVQRRVFLLGWCTVDWFYTRESAEEVCVAYSSPVPKKPKPEVIFQID